MSKAQFAIVNYMEAQRDFLRFHFHHLHHRIPRISGRESLLISNDSLPSTPTPYELIFFHNINSISSSVVWNNSRGSDKLSFGVQKGFRVGCYYALNKKGKPSCLIKNSFEKFFRVSDSAKENCCVRGEKCCEKDDEVKAE